MLFLFCGPCFAQNRGKGVWTGDIPSYVLGLVLDIITVRSFLFYYSVWFVSTHSA